MSKWNNYLQKWQRKLELCTHNGFANTAIPCHHKIQHRHQLTATCRQATFYSPSGWKSCQNGTITCNMLQKFELCTHKCFANIALPSQNTAQTPTDSTCKEPHLCAHNQSAYHATPNDDRLQHVEAVEGGNQGVLHFLVLPDCLLKIAPLKVLIAEVLHSLIVQQGICGFGTLCVVQPVEIPAFTVNINWVTGWGFRM